MSRFYFIVLTLLLTGCGTTSSIKHSGEGTSNLDFSNYNSVVVTNFEDGTSKQNLPETAGQVFVDRIVSAILAKGVFDQVTSDTQQVTGNAIQVSGDITRYAKGNAALKAFIGMGAGSTYFDALVKFSDLQTSAELGEIKVDKNSWALGGFIAASQDIDHFMDVAAKKIASELEEAKNNPTPVETE